MAEIGQSAGATRLTLRTVSMTCLLDLNSPTSWLRYGLATLNRSVPSGSWAGWVKAAWVWSTADSTGRDAAWR